MIAMYAGSTFEDLWGAAVLHFAKHCVDHSEEGFHKSDGAVFVVDSPLKIQFFNNNNPFTALFTLLQSLAGRDTVLEEMEPISPIYTDLAKATGKLSFGPGDRVRRYFGYRQDDTAIANLRSGIQTVTIQLYDPESDPDQDVQHGNLSLVLSVVDGHKLTMDVYLSFLNMHPTMFSNDLTYYAALHELIAANTGLKASHFRVHSTSLIAAGSTKEHVLKGQATKPAIYAGGVEGKSILQDNEPEEFAEDLADWFTVGVAMGYRTRFFTEVVIPMYQVREKLNQLGATVQRRSLDAQNATSLIRQQDWQWAASGYISSGMWIDQ